MHLQHITAFAQPAQDHLDLSARHSHTHQNRFTASEADGRTGETSLIESPISVYAARCTLLPPSSYCCCAALLGTCGPKTGKPGIRYSIYRPSLRLSPFSLSKKGDAGGFFGISKYYPSPCRPCPTYIHPPPFPFFHLVPSPNLHHHGPLPPPTGLNLLHLSCVVAQSIGANLGRMICQRTSRPAPGRHAQDCGDTITQKECGDPCCLRGSSVCTYLHVYLHTKVPTYMPQVRVPQARCTTCCRGIPIKVETCMP
jgi:hypothetical protein